MFIYTVQRGDSLYAIAHTYGSTPEAIIEDNQLAYPDRLVVGQALVIEGGSRTYTVKSGDTMFQIAQAHAISLESLLRANRQVTTIYPGQIIRIPDGSAPTRAVIANGYCYPHITEETLQATLPYLTYASIFSYEAKRDGSLKPLEDGRVLQRLRNTRVAPIMVLSNIDESGTFSSELASSILASEAVQNKLVENCRAMLVEKEYRGLDVDFEYVYGKDRERYNAFLQKLAEMLHPLGLPLSTAVAAKAKADQPGVLYEGADYAAHGRICDRVLLMTYDWGYRYGPPMAVSPYNRVEEVVRYAVSEIPSRKILLGMPNYGYDWMLPYREGTSAALVRNTGAIGLAANTWSEISFDEESRAPYFKYRDAQNKEHIVWFDDARSFEAKLSLVRQYDLGGIGYWNINTLLLQGWLVFNAMYHITKTM